MGSMQHHLVVAAYGRDTAASTCSQRMEARLTLRNSSRNRAAKLVLDCRVALARETPCPCGGGTQTSRP